MTSIEIIKTISAKIGVDTKEAEKILEKAIAGGETDERSAENWLNNRFLPNCVMIDHEGYSKMCVDALKILGTTAPTDYGSSRQRDLGQLWADMTRGYLGEYAFVAFLKQRWGITAELGHEVGTLQEYLPSDIHSVQRSGEHAHTPQLKVGIKATKWNGIWFDIPGGQFEHSDIHVLVKVGTGRDHLFAFLKNISVFRDKVLKVGQEIGSLTSTEASNLYDSLPNFKPVPAYICGFVRRGDKFSNLSYSGRTGKKHYKITSWNGPIKPGDLAEIKKQENISGNVTFEGIGDFAHDSGYLFNAGSLSWEDADWDKVCKKL